MLGVRQFATRAWPVAARYASHYGGNNHGTSSRIGDCLKNQSARASYKTKNLAAAFFVGASVGFYAGFHTGLFCADSVPTL